MTNLPTEFVPSQPTGDRKWYEIWWDIWKRPGEEAFQALLKERDHSHGRALSWVFIISFILSTLIALLIMPRVLSTLTNDEFSRYNPIAQLIVGAGTIILFTALAFFGLLITTGFLHLVAPAFSGYGKWDELLICISAIMAPYFIMGTFFSSLGIFIIQRIGFRLITIILFWGVVIYTFTPLVNGLKVAENLSKGSAVATLLLPLGSFQCLDDAVQGNLS